MTDPATVVLDSSALLAFLHEEPGAAFVEDNIRATAVMSAVNWAESLSKLIDFGEDADAIATDLVEGGIVGQALVIWPFDDALAQETARLRRQTKAAGLSIGDRACLALGRSLRTPVLTADKRWASLDLDIDVRAIR